MGETEAELELVDGLALVESVLHEAGEGLGLDEGAVVAWAAALHEKAFQGLFAKFPCLPGLRGGDAREGVVLSEVAGRLGSIVAAARVCLATARLVHFPAGLRGALEDWAVVVQCLWSPLAHRRPLRLNSTPQVQRGHPGALRRLCEQAQRGPAHGFSAGMKRTFRLLWSVQPLVALTGDAGADRRALLRGAVPVLELTPDVDSVQALLGVLREAAGIWEAREPGSWPDLLEAWLLPPDFPEALPRDAAFRIYYEILPGS